jgi:hypothetical protein
MSKLNRFIIFAIFVIVVLTYLNTFHYSSFHSSSESLCEQSLHTTQLSIPTNQFALKEDVRPKIAYIFAGSVRSFTCPQVHWSIRMHLIDALGGHPFIFVRLAVEDNLNVRTGTGRVWKPDYTDKELNETLRVLNPTQVQYFSFDDQIEEMKAVYPGWMHEVYRENDLRRYSMYFHRCLAYRMALAYEMRHNITFDWVVLVRLDAMWLVPVLPIESYPNDRVWLTETGFVPFNDQFMLIPRQFSDYLYDLNTKVRKDVYCLGGPDVERWKCNRTELENRGIVQNKIAATLELCCRDFLTRGIGNKDGYSEIIHFRHLQHGKIPIGFGYFPVLLTRIQQNGWRCFPECERLQMNSKIDYAKGNISIYPFLKNSVWPDTRGRAINIGDHSLCEILVDRHVSMWDPPAAVQLAEHHAINYTSRSLFTDTVIASKVVLSPRLTELWRIRPGWNVEGCLTFDFLNKTHFWGPCRDRSKRKGGMKHDASQLFHLSVVRHHRHHSSNPVFEGQMSEVPVPNTTRVLMVNREPKWWGFIDLWCLTVSNVGEIKEETRLYFERCYGSRDPVALRARQQFYTVHGTVTGSNSLSTIGELRPVLAEGHLCVTQSRDVLGDYAVEPESSELFLSSCSHEGRMGRMRFEFELSELFA